MIADIETTPVILEFYRVRSDKMLTKNFYRVRSNQILHNKNSSYQVLHDKNSGKRNFYRVRSDKTTYKINISLIRIFIV